MKKATDSASENTAKATEKNKCEQKEAKKNSKKRNTPLRLTLKITAYVISILLALLLLILIFRDNIIKIAAPAAASWALGVEVTMDDFDSTLSGEVTISGLRVANPAGFERECLLELNHFYIDLDMASLFSKQLVIEKLEATGISVVAEFDTKDNFNFTMISDHISKTFPPTEKKPPSPYSLLIKELKIDFQVIVLADRIKVPLTLPRISYNKTDMLLEDDGVPFAAKAAAWSNLILEKCKIFTAADVLKRTYTDVVGELQNQSGGVVRNFLNVFKRQ